MKSCFHYEQVFSQINDFGEPYMEPENGMISPIGYDQPAIEPNDMNQINNNGANAVDVNIENDISCETIPPSPIRNVVYRDRVKKRMIDVTPKKKPIDLPRARDNTYPSPKVNGALSVPRADDVIPSTPLQIRRILSRPENLDDSQLTDDNNNSPFANNNNRMPTQPDPIDDIIPETPVSAHNIPAQPDDDVGIASPAAAENVVPTPNAEGTNLPSQVRFEPVDAINPQTPIGPDNIPAQPDDDVPMPLATEATNAMPNADEIIVPSPVKSEPRGIEAPVIPPKRKRRSAPKKKKQGLRIDDVIMLDVTEMRERIENPTVDCKQPQADVISKTDILLRKEAAFFTVPTIDGEVNRKLFKRNLVQTEEEHDLSIIHAILGIPENDQPEPDDNNNRGQESQVIVGDQLRKRSSRKRKSPDVEPRAQSEPMEMPIPEGTALPTPVEPMDGIESQLVPNLSGMHISLPDEQLVDIRPRRTPSQADDTLNENDKMVLRKLRALWKRKIHSVTMTSITERKSSRLQAAKNFASILSKFDLLDLYVFLFTEWSSILLFHFAVLKKLRLVEVEADESGQIQHIAKGNAGASQNIWWNILIDQKLTTCPWQESVIFMFCTHIHATCVCVCCLQFIIIYK